MNGHLDDDVGDGGEHQVVREEEGQTHPVEDVFALVFGVGVHVAHVEEHRNVEERGEDGIEEDNSAGGFVSEKVEAEVSSEQFTELLAFANTPLFLQNRKACVETLILHEVGLLLLYDHWGLVHHIIRFQFIHRQVVPHKLGRLGHLDHELGDVLVLAHAHI